jgi:hypothetical protein
LGLIIPDFDRSYLRWVLRGSSSVGVFLLDSITRISLAKSNPALFVLTSGVLAGNMYAGGCLVKQPPYLYQMICSKDVYRILRTGSPPEPGLAFSGNPTSDSSGWSVDFFESLEVEACWKTGDCLRRVHPGLDLIRPGGRLMASVALTGGHSQAQIFFPIRHWNRLGNTGKYQIETGPVLWPDLQKLSRGEMLDTGDFLPAFLHFGSDNEVNVSLDYPGFIRSFRGGSPGRFFLQPCTAWVYEILA